MVTDYHRQVESALIELGNTSCLERKIRKVCCGNIQPLSIVDSRSKLVVNYQPDVYYILRNNKKLIFEILDSEIEKQDSIIADVISSFLVENVEGLFFLYSGPQSAEKTIMEALITIYKGLINKGVVQSELPNFRKTGAYLITKKEAAEISNLVLKITGYSTDDHWFTRATSHPKRSNSI